MRYEGVVPFTFHLSSFTFHLSPITYYLLPITYYLFPSPISLFKGALSDAFAVAGGLSLAYRVGGDG